MSAMMNSLNAKIQNSAVGRYFEFEARKTNFTTEVVGGTATFLTMAYILAVNPMILAESGGPCETIDGNPFTPEYEACQDEIKKQYVVSTALCSAFACVLMGVVANLPIALSCGMGMNAYFTYNVVGFRGFGASSYKAAITAVLIEGVIFLVLALTGARFAMVKLIPEPIRLATPAAIGCFLAHLGLQSAEGIGLVVSDIATGVTLGACAPENRVPIVAFTDACKADAMSCVTSEAYTCDDLGGIMRSGTTWVGILGMFIVALLLSYKKKYSFIVGIAFVTFISWFRDTAITIFPDSDVGDAKFEYFQKVVSVEKLDQITFQFTGDLGDVKEITLALFTFLYVDFLDTSGTLLALVYSMGMVDEVTGDFPKSRQAFAVDAIATIFGSFFGLSPVTSYIESAAGVEAGARTGVAAIVCGFYFLVSIFFAPVISSVPAWATGGSLIIVGALMCRCVVKIKWNDPAHAITAFVTIILMPLTYSVAYGIIGGLMIWTGLSMVFWLLRLVGIERPSFDDEAVGMTKIVETDESVNDKLQKSEVAMVVDEPEMSETEA